jgi:predicted ATPase
LERAAGFTHDDSAATKLDKLDALLARSFTPATDAALFAELLSLPSDGRYPTIELTPQQRRRRTFETLTTQIVSLAEQRPVLMIFEDYVTALSLNRLGKREIGAMIGHVAGNHALPDTMRQDIIERTDGIPLFVEEMTRAVLEAESEGEARRTAAAVPSAVVAVPASLHASLLARLDRLGPAKEVAQIGAAIGREFSGALVSAVARKEEADLQAALDRLTGAGLLFRQGEPPHATYLFKHGLVQDAAYSTLLRERRRSLHARIAEVLEKQFPEIVESQPELVARHCTEAGLIENAADFWAKAGRRSLARSALAEAIAQLTRALDQIATLPATPALRREQINLQVALITPLIHVKGHSSPEVRGATERARALIEQAEAIGEPPENPLLLYSVLMGFWITNAVAFNGDALRTLAAQFLALAEKQGATIPLMIGHSLMAYSLLTTGSPAQSRGHYDHAIALYDPAAHRPLAMLFGQDIGAAALSHRSNALWLLGYPEAALADTNHALKDAREIDQAGTLLHTLNYATIAHFLLGNYAAAEGLAKELFVLADEKAAAVWKPAGLLYQGWIFAVVGKASEAVQLIAPGLAACRSTGTTTLTPVGLSLLAKSYADLGQFDDAWRSIDEAKTVIDLTKETWFEPHVHRIAGEIALMSSKPDVAKAEAYFERALSVARQQQAKSWELRAAMSLARLWRDQGKPQQAREILAPVYGWFTEGFDTRDLKDAKALLGELAA